MKSGVELTEEMLQKQIAASLASGVALSAIAKELGINYNKAKRISNSEMVKRTMLEIAEEAVGVAKHQIKANTAHLVEGIMDTIKHHLNNKNLNAVPIALKILGFEEKEQKDQPSQFTIVLPGAEAPKDITPQYEEVVDVAE
jgi:hypothetical protein